MRKRLYNLKELTTIIVQYNRDIFIPKDVIESDLEVLFVVRRLIKRHILSKPVSYQILRNNLIVSFNCFGIKCIVLYKMILTEDEYEYLLSELKDAINSIKNN